jgi:cytochrome c-type biogenesis protein CcmH
VFYLLAAVLLALGAALIPLSLRRGAPSGTTTSRDRTVAALYQDRLEELAREIDGGQAAAEDRQTLEEELGAALLADYREAGDAATGKAGERRNLAAVGTAAAVLLLGCAIGVYLMVGDPQSMSLTGAEAVLELEPGGNAPELNQWRNRLVERVDARPGDAKSWYLLGHADLKLGHFSTAAEAFAMAHQAHGEDPGIDLYWLQARYLADGGQLDARSRQIAERILARNPNQAMVLEIYALDAYRRGAFDESVSLLNRALSGSLAARDRLSLDAAYTEARERLGTPGPAVDVEINAEGELPGGATLFVIARPVGGGMPYAVVRRPLGELPRTIRLDDAVSMNPAAPLSSAGALEIVVRLSRAGTAMAHPGDWEWRSEALTDADLAAPPLKLRAALEAPES